MINTPVFVIFLKKTRLSMDFDGFLAKEPKKAQNTAIYRSASYKEEFMALYKEKGIKNIKIT
jgi:hypothetical protein